MNFKLLFPSFATRALTFSYDDGIIEDKTTLTILNRYHLKGTFNLNLAKSGEVKFRNGIDCSYLNFPRDLELYAGHEIANHTFTHPHLENLPLEVQEKEYLDNNNALLKMGYPSMKGSAYPFGTYDDNTLRALQKLGIVYARTVRSTYAFHRPYNYLLWHPTIHHRDPLLFPLFEKFLKDEEELPIFYVWGHSYEFALDDNFEVLDQLCAKASGYKKDLYSASNLELYTYCENANRLYFRDNTFVNPSDCDVYLKVNSEHLLVKKHSSLGYTEEKI